MSFKNELLIEANKFRTNPKSIEQRVQTFRLGLSRLRARDPFLLEIDAFISSLNDLKPMPPLKLNEVLSKAAEKQVEVFSRDEAYFDNKKEQDEKILLTKINCFLTQLAIAWIIANPDCSTTILGESQVS